MTPTEAISILRETVDDAHNYVAHQSADYATKNQEALTVLQSVVDLKPRHTADIMSRLDELREYWVLCSTGSEPPCTVEEAQQACLEWLPIMDWMKHQVLQMDLEIQLCRLDV